MDFIDIALFLILILLFALVVLSAFILGSLSQFVMELREIRLRTPDTKFGPNVSPPKR